MSVNDMTIYQTCRKVSGMTQERAAELLCVATRTLAAWESGERPVPDLRVADMVDLYGTPYLAMQHLRLYSALGPKVLPEVQLVPLPQAVCQLLSAIRAIDQARAGMSGQAKAFRYVMSHATGKIEILGRDRNGEMLFKYHQAKYPKDASRFFTAKLAEDQCWLPNDIY